MPKQHVKNTVRYYLLEIILLSFLFFSNDFGLIDVQKTAIVVAVGIDREEEGFVLTSQIAVPQASQQGGSSKSVQLVSRGKTVAQAFEEINAKTGWYPKLVFCKLIILGEETCQENVFDALDYFLRNEYLTDDCQVATCTGRAQDILNTSALVDPSSSSAMSKVLSSHAERVGRVHPSNLKDFSIGYFGESQSGLLPLLKTEPQQEKPPSSGGSQGGGSGTSGGEGSGSGANTGSNGSSGEGSGGSTPSKEQEQPVFSAKQTALFVRGRWVETLSEEETFALNAATGKLRLASYSVEVDGQTCTLSVKHNAPKIKLNVGKDGRGEVQVQITMTAGAMDYSKAQNVEEIKDMGNVPDGTFAAAEKKLTAELSTAYEKARKVGCDVLELQERLVKFKQRKYLQHRDTLLDNTTLSVKVKFENLR